MARITQPVMLALLLLSGGVPLAAADYHPCQGFVVPLPPSKAREGSLKNEYGGVVTAVTEDSITIQWVNSRDEKPKTFAVSETLAAGKTPIERRLPAGLTIVANPMMPEYMYRLTDVKVGDCVGIFYARLGGVDICDHIRICRRPGGEVPPLPKDAEDLRDPREIWKVKHPGRPLPDHVANRRYVPYHEWTNEFWARVAPMPREVKPRP